MSKLNTVFEGLDNFRDFGGYVTAEGRRLKTGLLYRSANHGRLTEGDMQTLESLGVSTIVDLRRGIERRLEPSRRWPSFDGEVIENDIGDADEDPWLTFLRTADLSPAGMRGYMLDFYRNAPLEERHIELYARYFAALETTPGAVLVHCAGGKDRTGLLVALTHHLAGVPDEHILHDYLLTNTQAQLHTRGPQMARFIERAIGRRPSDEAAVAGLLIEDAHLRAGFGAMTDAYGSVDGYLEQALGVTPQRKAAIRERLLD